MRTEVQTPVATTRLTKLQMLVIASIFALIGRFFLLTQLEVDVNLGVVALTIAVVLALVDPGVGRRALNKVDWSTILLLGGIITYVGILTRPGAIDQLGEAARSVSQPLSAAVVICVIAGLVSAFASTIGILGALIPLAVPLLVPGGGVEMTGLIYALAIPVARGLCAVQHDRRNDRGVHGGAPPRPGEPRPDRLGTVDGDHRARGHARDHGRALPLELTSDSCVLTVTAAPI